MNPIIEIIQKDLQTQIDGAVVKAVQEVGITIDKERLKRALYDAKAFYEEGYRDGMAANPPVVHGEWVFIDHDETGYQVQCSHCKTVFVFPSKDQRTKHCPECGAKMDGGNE